MSQKGGMLGIYIDKINMNGNPNWMEIKVSDTGAGIPEEIISKVFDPYYSTRPGGTGLGLTITKKIIEQHEGQLDIQSFPGGTTFFVRLPATKNGEKG